MSSAVWTRSEAIDRLRAALQPMCGTDRSMCDVAAEKGIFCRGFRRWHDSEFHRRWRGALGTSTHLTRAQMERLADLWQLSEQLRCGVAFACDASARASRSVPGVGRVLERRFGEVLRRSPRERKSWSYRRTCGTRRTPYEGLM